MATKTDRPLNAAERRLIANYRAVRGDSMRVISTVADRLAKVDAIDPKAPDGRKAVPGRAPMPASARRT